MLDCELSCGRRWRVEAGLKKTTLYIPHFGPCLVGMLLLKGRSSLVVQLAEMAQEILRNVKPLHNQTSLQQQ